MSRISPTVGALVTQRLQVVLQARQRIGERVELLAVRHAPAADQFGLGVAPHAGQVLGRLREFEDAERAPHFLEQARDLGQFGMVPAGLHERDERLARVAEVGDRLAHQDVQDLARLAGGHVLLGGVGQAESRDLVVEGRVHVQQRAGDVEQCALVGLAVAVDDVVHRVALLQHHVARHAQAHHAERVGDPAERLDLRLQVGDAGLPGPQVQVERVLDAQQVFLDRRRDGVEQRAVVSADAAARVRHLRLGRQVAVERERLAQPVERRVRAVAMGDVVEQLARRFEGGLGARRGEAVVVGHAAGFAFHAGEGLAQRGRRGERTVADGLGDAAGHPEHAARGLVLGVGEQGLDRLREGRRIGGGTVLGPVAEGGVERVQATGDLGLPGLARLGRRHRQRLGQRPVQVGREQHALGQPALAARGAQFIEQRQQHHRDVAVAALQALQVVRQLHHATHQRGAGVFMVRDAAACERLRQPLHLLGHHRRRVQLHHPQGAVHLVQEAGAKAHAAGVAGRVGEGLDLVPSLAQGLVQLRLDPAERGGVDRVADRAHRQPLPGVAWAARGAQRPGAVRLILANVPAVRPAA
jgi:hypothetical protein